MLFVVFYRKIFIVTFDEGFAKVSGLKVGRYTNLIAVLSAVVIVIGMRMMGVMLISSIIIFPAIISMRLFKSFKRVVNKGISAFIVEKGTPGFSIGKKEKKMGIRGSATTELVFEDCRIPKENLLGQQGKGFAIAMKTLDGGRVGIAAQALGIAQGAMDETIKYTKECKQFGRSISQFQNTQFQMADMETKVQAARLLVRSAHWKKDNGIPYSVDAAMAKLFAAETAMEVTTKAVQLHGGYGYTREYPVERMMRDAKITEIYEDTSEVQKMVILVSITLHFISR